ncbi:LysR family transcriptional regulator [Consotaella salsifontis]|uniref:Transcriptional regulator, LysR family n=1 Tax=Consotaella salsifontis TaxID=1365950 RepID=A0A1T4T268_9HYPH|nr:LysR family transcriptional regulator [Consotaella salsifontis]SKA34507.1 transcriptional regulator, LysR family [Consotaella salsifontis]
MTPSAASRAMTHLEDRLGVRLLNRTTRSVALTPAGEALSGRLPALVAAMEAAVDDVVALSDAPSGVVRLNLPRVAAELLLAPRLAPFTRAFPAIKLDLSIDDGLSDIVAKGHDAGIRVGGRLAQDMAAVRLTADLSAAVVGSPEYFQNRPRLEHPRDLLQHSCLNYRWQQTQEAYRWRFEEDGRAIELSIEASLTVDDTGILREAVLNGMGLACLPDRLVAPLVASGRLVRVLEDFCPAQPGFFLYYPLNGHPSAALKAFIGFVRAAGATR